jgi:proline dehydrogenase
MRQIRRQRITKRTYHSIDRAAADTELAEDLARRGRKIRLFVPYGQDWQRYVNKRVADAQAAERSRPGPSRQGRREACHTIRSG